jgi:hypothetical protein
VLLGCARHPTLGHQNLRERREVYYVSKSFVSTPLVQLGVILDWNFGPFENPAGRLFTLE